MNINEANVATPDARDANTKARNNNKNNDSLLEGAIDVRSALWHRNILLNN